MPDSPPILNYAQAPRSRKRLYLWIAGMLLLAGLCIFVSPRISRYVDHAVAARRYLAVQAAACNRTMDPSLVCYTDDPAVSAKLPGGAYTNPGIYESYGGSPVMHIDLNHYFLSKGLAPLDSDLWTLGRPAGMSMPVPLSTTGRASVFMHQLRSPAGHQRLVSVVLEDGGTEIEHDSLNTALRTGTYALASPTTPPSVLNSHTLTLYRWNANHPLTVFAGQPDPNDRSHFTIPIQFRGQRTVVDGYLRDDDSVLLDPHLGYIVNGGSGHVMESHAIDGYALKTIGISAPAFTLPGSGKTVPHGQQPTYSACAFSPDAAMLAVGVNPPNSRGGSSGPARLRLIDARTGKDVREFQTTPPMKDAAYAIAFSPDGTLLATMDGTQHADGGIRLWNVATGDPIGDCVAGDVRTFSAMRFDPGGKQFIATNNDTQYVFSLPDLKFLRTQPVPSLREIGTIVQPKGATAYNGQPFGAYHDHDDDKLAPTPGEYHAPDDPLYDQIAPGAASGISPDGRWFAWSRNSAGDGVVWIEDLQKHAVCLQRMVWKPPNWTWIGSFQPVTFTPDGRLLACSVDGHGLCLWQMPDCDLMYDIQIQPKGAYWRALFFAISPDDKHVATIDFSDNLNVWDLPAPDAAGK
jgi:WD40 repeat protein